MNFSILRKFFQNDYATSWEGHLAGGLTGILLGIVVLKNRRVEKWETWLKLVCVLSYTVAILAMIMANIFVSNCKDGCYFKEEWTWTKYEEVRSNISQSFHINCTWYQLGKVYKENRYSLSDQSQFIVQVSYLFVDSK